MSKEQNTIIGKKFHDLRSTTSYPILHNTIVDLLRVSPPPKLPYIRDSIARILQASYNKEASKIKEDPQALDAVDQKYNALHVLVKRLSTPRVPSRIQPSRTQLAALQNKPKWGSPLVLGGVFLTTLGGAFYLYTKYNKKDGKSTSSPTSGFQKTLKAIQKYKLISQLDFDSNFLEDYESIMKGKLKGKKIARKKPYSKVDTWNKEEGDLMKEIDSSFRSINTNKHSSYKIPQLPASKDFDPFSILNNKTRNKKTSKRPKEVFAEPIEDTFEEAVEEPVEEFDSIEEVVERIPRQTRKKRSTITNSQLGERLIPIVKRTKRISKIKM